MSEVTLSEIERRLAVCEQAVKDLSDKITATDHNLVATTTTLNSVLATLGELKGAVESLKARPATMWDKLIYAVIGAAGAAIITYLIGGKVWSVIELPETLQSTAPAPAPQSALADIYKEAYNTINFGWRQASGKVGDGDGYSKITDTYHIDSNNGVRISQKLNGFEEKYRTSEIEHSLVISSNGIAYEVSGISGAVNTELVGADALEGSTIIHNHPVWDGYDKGDSFSLDDLLFAARNRAGKQYLSSGTRKDAFLYPGTYNENDIRSAYHKARQEILKRAFETGEPIQFEQEEIMRILGKYLEGFEYYENIRF